MAGSPTKVITLPLTAGFPERAFEKPQFINGRFVRVKRSYTPDTPSQIWLYDREGRTLIDGAEIRVPTARETLAGAITVSQDGGILVSVRLWEDSGAMSTALCHLKAPGTIDSVKRTTSFAAKHIIGSPTGSIWSLGFDRDGDGKAKADDSLLRVFDASGTEVAQRLRQTDFLADENPASLLGGPLVGSSKTSIGVFLPVSGKWFEFKFDGTPRDEFAIRSPHSAATAKDPAVTLVLGSVLGMSESGRVYALFGPPRSTAGIRFLPEVGVYELDRSAHKWVFVRNSLGDSDFAGLFGIHGKEVIKRSGCCTFGWFDLADVVAWRLQVFRSH